MPDKKWKQWERDVAALIGGKRMWANSGELIDCEGPTIVAQCKLVSRLSLEDVAELAATAAAQGVKKGKLGIVALRLKRGKGVPSPEIVAMTKGEFARILRLMIVTSP